MVVRRLVLLFVFAALALTAPVAAHDDATPTAEGEPDIVMTLAEHAGSVTNIDIAPEGPSVGDQIIWGPNPLFDETGETDTGAVTQGVCTAFTVEGDCLLLETIVFPDGSTLELQGIQPGEAKPSTRTIVAGSGIYLGARGTVSVAPTEDRAVWTKTFEIWLDEA
jgi:hypothetical protein